MLAELTHRCPLQCPYCSNPLELERATAELTTEEWCRVFSEAADLGILQVHLSGGEPMARKDIRTLVAHATSVGIYSNLITSAALLNETSFPPLVEAGLEHVQISLQDVEADGADRIAGFKGAHQRKLHAADLVRQAGLPLTLNFVVHRQNLARLPQMIGFGLEMGAKRIEIAHVQYYGWGLINRQSLLPTRAQLDQATAEVERARKELAGRMVIDYVVPDYYAARPKACMGGWARRFINISPAGKALPCHAAESLPGFEFPSVRTSSMAEIWYESEAFQRFRGTDWMPEPCRSCDRREIDWGGCRCQAFALTGDAARVDPACALSPDHDVMLKAIEESADRPSVFVYRRIGGAAPVEPWAAEQV